MTPPPSLTDIRQVRLERRGGIAGLHLETSLDWSALSSSQRQALSALLERAGESGLEPSPGADRFRYRVHLVPESGPERALEVDEAAFPTMLERLLRPGD